MWSGWRSTLLSAMGVWRRSVCNVTAILEGLLDPRDSDRYEVFGIRVELLCRRSEVCFKTSGPSGALRQCCWKRSTFQVIWKGERLTCYVLKKLLCCQARKALDPEASRLFAVMVARS